LKINSALTSKRGYKLHKPATELQRYLSDCGRSQVTTTPSYARNCTWVDEHEPDEPGGQIWPHCFALRIPLRL